MAFRLLSLPPELLRKVISLAQITDLKAIRIACKILKPHASEFLFQTVHLELLQESFERLMAISEHPHFSKTVRIIEYCPRRLEPMEYLEKFETFYFKTFYFQGNEHSLDNSDENSLDGWDEDSLEDWDDQPTAAEILSYFDNHSSHQAFQQEVLEDSRLFKRIASAFAKFPLLSSIAIRDHLIYLDSEGRATDTSSIMRNVVDQIGVSPCFEHEEFDL